MIRYVKILYVSQIYFDRPLCIPIRLNDTFRPFKVWNKNASKISKKKKKLHKWKSSLNFIYGWILESTYQKKGYDEVTSCDLTKRIQNHKEYSIHVVINQSIT